MLIRLMCGMLVLTYLSVVFVALAVCVIVSISSVKFCLTQINDVTLL